MKRSRSDEADSGKPAKKSRDDAATAAQEEAADALKVAQMYDRVAASDAAASANRGKSGVDPLAHLRVFNNWVKRTLIAEYCGAGDAVLDLACGRGGDIFKIAETKPRRYVGCDIARGSLEEFVQRINDEATKRALPPITLVHADLGAHALAPCLAAGAPFDVAQCQFALHYFFQSRARATNVFTTVAAALKPGGYFVGTTVDADVVAMLMRRPEARRGTSWRPIARPSTSGSSGSSGSTATAKCVGFENAICRVRFDGADNARAADDVLLGRPRFGTRYSFQLGALVEDDCDEYLAPMDLLRAIGAEAGLQLVATSNFHEFYAERMGRRGGGGAKARPLGERAYGENGVMPSNEWETVRLYTTFVFQRARVGGGAPVENGGGGGGAGAKAGAGAAAGPVPSAAAMRASDIISLF